MGKHAYLIMAHNKFDQLAFLTSLLDYELNDLFIYIDKSVTITDEEIEAINKSVSKSKIIFVPREIDVYWGNSSQIECEMYLYDYAYKYGDYDLFHLISGTDLPLVSQEKMHAFFDDEERKGYNYITRFSKKEFDDKKFIRKIKFYHMTTKMSLSTMSPLKRKLVLIYRRIEHESQKLLHINRLKSIEKEGGTGVYYSCANWKSITKETIEAILRNREFISKHFKHTLCADELYFPLIIEKENLQNKIWRFDEIHDIPDELQGNLRYVNWWYDYNSSHPYVWTDSFEDQKVLDHAIELGHFFARKFDLDKYPGVKDYIISRVKS